MATSISVAVLQAIGLMFVHATPYTENTIWNVDFELFQSGRLVSLDREFDVALQKINERGQVTRSLWTINQR